MKRFWWMSTTLMTVCVEVDEVQAVQVVTAAPPIVKKFKGQPFANLIEWMNRQRGFRICELDPPVFFITPKT